MQNWESGGLGPSSSSMQTPSAVLAGLRVPAKDLSSAVGAAWCPARNMKHLASARPLLGTSGILELRFRRSVY